MNTRFIELAGEVNSHMPDYVISKVGLALNDHNRAIKGSKILVLGIAYKKNVDDMRESPSVEVMDRLHAFDNGPVAAAAPIFDAALEQRVRALQVAYGIRDDGIVGPETQFALSALDDSGPHLARTLQ